MAESITEGTLKSWSKQVGDTVTADEEIATIETDKVQLDQFNPWRHLTPSFNDQIDVSVNAPTSGTIVKLLANEEDTVTVGQDLFVLEPGEVGGCTSYSQPLQNIYPNSQ